jgi:hypothetical protein
VPALGDFKREIAMPIKRSRKRTADEEARQRGREKLLQLRTLVKHSILGVRPVPRCCVVGMKDGCRG